LEYVLDVAGLQSSTHASSVAVCSVLIASSLSLACVRGAPEEEELEKTIFIDISQLWYRASGMPLHLTAMWVNPHICREAFAWQMFAKTYAFHRCRFTSYWV